MIIKINTQKLIENSEDYILNWNTKLNSRGQVVLDSSKGENKLGFYVENYLLKMTSEELDNLFDNRCANLVDEPPVGMFEEWNRVLILKGMISNSLGKIFEAEYSKDEVVGKKPGNLLYKNLATKFIRFIHTDMDKATIEYNTNNRKWKMKYC